MAELWMSPSAGWVRLQLAAGSTHLHVDPRRRSAAGVREVDPAFRIHNQVIGCTERPAIDFVHYSDRLPGLIGAADAFAWDALGCVQVTSFVEGESVRASRAFPHHGDLACGIQTVQLERANVREEDSTIGGADWSFREGESFLHQFRLCTSGNDTGDRGL
jgi:hypothetical protein